jgi:hypothetical protein
VGFIVSVYVMLGCGWDFLAFFDGMFLFVWDVRSKVSVRGMVALECI